MKKLSLAVVALCLLLCGCGGKTTETQPLEATAETTGPVETTESLMIEFTEEAEVQNTTEAVAPAENTEATQPKTQQDGTSSGSGSAQPPATQPAATEPPVTEPTVQETQAPTEGSSNAGGIELPDDNWD